MTEKMITVTEKHSFALRFFHWANVVLLSLMIWSGVLIYWANQAYIKIPPSLAKSLSIEYSLARGMGWHFFIMWPFALNGLCYGIYLFMKGEWKRQKYKGIQRLAYIGVTLMGAGSLVTGLAIYKPVQTGWLTSLLGGYGAARFEHFILTAGFILFIIVHVVQVARAGWNNFRAMLAGYEIEKS